MGNTGTSGRGRVVVSVVAALAAVATIVPMGDGPLVAPPAADAATLQPGFEDTAVIGGLTNPTVVRFAPDGRVFVAEKSGIIKVYSGLDDRTPTVVADLRTQVHNYWDRGLLGFNLDPQFPTQPYLYVLYVRDAEIGGTAPRWGTAGATSDPCPTPPGPVTDGCVVSIRLARLRLDGDVATGGEQVLIDDWCQQFPSHAAGDIEFGPDGALYASAGDGGNITVADYGQAGQPVNPCGDPPGGVGIAGTAPTAQGGSLRSQDARTTGDPLGLDGTVIRVDRATGAGVAGNPWASGADPARSGGNWSRVIAYGMRNPFRMALRPGTGELYVGDVGNGGFEEVNRIADPGGTAENFGWPCYEGAGPQPAFGGFDLCTSLYAEAGAVVAPTWSYAHRQPVTAGDTCATGSSSISGIAFYEGGAYPDAYNGAMFAADYSRDCVWAVPPTGDPITVVDGAHGPVDLEIGPGGDVFYIDLVGGSVRRLTWNTLAPPDRSAYVSDVNWRSYSNGWGPVELDTSNGEDQPLDGGRLTIGGTGYDKGIGVHAPSAIDIPLEGNCTRLTADIGVDDEVGAGGSVLFTVRTDGTERYRSPVRRGTDAATAVDVDLTGVETLVLGVEDAGDGSTVDHADWADAHLTCGEAAPTPLTDRAWASASNGWGPVEVDRSNGEDAAGDGRPLTLNGTTYERGLGVHAPSRVVYELGGACSSFRAALGLDGEMTTGGSVVFRVEGDGRVLYESAPMGPRSATRPLDVDIQGVDRLALVVTDAGDGTTWDHADWAGAGLVCGGAAGGGRAHIDGPLATTHWRVGDTISFQGGAEDADGTALPASALSWSVVMAHCPESCHAHEIQRFDGVATGSFVAPDHEYPSHLELRLTATLPDGGTVTRRMDLDPRTVDLRFESDPPGLPLVVGGVSATTPFTRTVMAGSLNTIEAPATATTGGGAVAFSAWSDGGPRSHDVVAPPATTYRATYRSTPVTRLTGTVTDASTGAGVPGAWVSLLRPADYSVAAGITADRSGTFLAEVPAGSYYLYVVDPSGGHAAGFHGTPTTVTVTAGNTTDVDPPMVSLRGAIAGTVTKAGSGAPIGGAWVIGINATTGATQRGAVANVAGQYSIGGLRAGPYRPVFVDPTGAHGSRYFPNSVDFLGATSLAVTAGASAAANVALLAQSITPGAQALSGTVVEAGTNAPLGGVFVVALRASDFRNAGGAVTNGSGQYSLNVAAGDYKMAFVDSTGLHNMEWHDNQPNTGLATATSVTAPVVTNAALDANTGAMAGTVTDDPSGNPLVGAWVVAIDPSGAIAGGAVTAANGTYTIAGLAPGTYRATIVDPNGGRTQEYYDNSVDFAGATTVNVTAGTTATVNAALALP